jgi:hypothetical protein
MAALTDVGTPRFQTRFGPFGAKGDRGAPTPTPATSERPTPIPESQVQTRNRSKISFETR